MELKDKAVDIKGKAYVLVKDRVLYFNEKYPDGSITTDVFFYESHNMWSVQAKIYPEKGHNRYFSGHSQAVIGDGYINKTAALENAETSAVGRALAFMGIGVIDSIASVDEIAKTGASVADKKAPPAPKQKDPYEILSEVTGESVNTVTERLSINGIKNKAQLKKLGREAAIKIIKGEE
jgi:hypothetical protein